MIGRGRDLSVERDEISIVVRSTESPRLDQFLLDNLAWRSRNRIQRLIREGIVTVNCEIVKPSRRVRPGDEVRIRLSPGAGAAREEDWKAISIVYEDPWFVAVDKPAGLLVHPVGHHVYDTLINFLHRRHRASGASMEFVPRLCHRIDKSTTGLVVAAKDADALRELSLQFERREVLKEYVTLVAGVVGADERDIDVPIGEGPSLAGALEHPALKAARTTLRVERRFERHSLLRCIPRTGRQNQIRIHLAAIGHPLVGDTRFGGVREDGFPPRYLLHAEGLRFHHPFLKSAVELRTPPPADFRHVVERLDGGA